MGTVMPGPGGVATEDVSAVADVASGDKVRELFTRKGVRIISPIVSQAAQGDGISTANLVGVLSELDSQVAANYAAWVYLFNGTTMDRLRGDTNGLQAQGTVAHDAVDVGKPVAIGGFATQDVSAEADVDAGDRVRGIFTLKGAQIIAASSAAGDAQNANAVRTLTEGDAENLLGVLGYGIAPDGLNDRIRTLGDVAQDGLGQLCVAAAVPGAGVVQATRAFRSSDTTRVTAITPAAGNRVRILAIFHICTSPTSTSLECYFGTGANLPTDITKSICEVQLDLTDLPTVVVSFGDGAGPVGAVDEVVSVRQTVSALSTVWIIIFREE